jgi:hypothetical protein
MSQIVNLLSERYPQHLSDSKRVAKIRDKMASTIEGAVMHPPKKQKYAGPS